MHPKREIFRIEIPVDDATEMKKFHKALDDYNNAVSLMINAEAKRLNISYSDMSSIEYLRTRSRWTQEKEDYLIKLAQEGKPLPNILSGEF